MNFNKQYNLHLDNLEKGALHMALEVEMAIDNIDQTATFNALKTSELFPLKEFIFLVDENGKIDLSNRKSLRNKSIKTFLPQVSFPLIMKRDEIHRVIVENDFKLLIPIHGRKQKTYLYVQYNVSNIRKDLFFNVMKLFLIGLGGILSVSIVFSLFLDKYFVHPYALLARIFGAKENEMEILLKELSDSNEVASHIGVEIIRLVQRLRESEGKLLKNNLSLMQNQKLQVIGQMSASVAHEVKNPLAFISMLTDSILSTNENIPYREEFVKIKEAADRGGVTLKELLQFSRQEDTLKDIDIHELLKNLILIHKIFLKDRGHTISLELGANISRVTGNPIKLQQIFTNLINNASDAIPTDQRGQIEIRTFNNNNNIIVSISDNGIGISEINQSKIYSNFFTTKEGSKGTGLGLGVVRKLIEELHGDIWFETEQGKGTTFYANFPTINV